MTERSRGRTTMVEATIPRGCGIAASGGRLLDRGRGGGYGEHSCSATIGPPGDRAVTRLGSGRPAGRGRRSRAGLRPFSCTSLSPGANSMTNKPEVSRRGFLETAGAATGALVAAGTFAHPAIGKVKGANERINFAI